MLIVRIIDTVYSGWRNTFVNCHKVVVLSGRYNCVFVIRDRRGVVPRRDLWHALHYRLQLHGVKEVGGVRHRLRKGLVQAAIEVAVTLCLLQQAVVNST